MILLASYLLITLFSGINNIPILYSKTCSISMPLHYYSDITNFSKFKEEIITSYDQFKECDIIIEHNNEPIYIFKNKNNYLRKIYKYFYSVGLSVSNSNRTFLLLLLLIKTTQYCISCILLICIKILHFLIRYINKNLLDSKTKTYKYNKEEENTCSICMEEYEKFDDIRELVCFHFYHKKCIDYWLVERRKITCPLCARQVI
jgi:hypothetical protein